MGQRTSDAQTFALTLNIAKDSILQARHQKSVNTNVDLTHSRAPSAKSQNSFSVVAQAPAKRGSLFESMQRKQEGMRTSFNNMNMNPNALLHRGRIKSSKPTKSTSVPNLDKPNKMLNKPSVPEPSSSSNNASQKAKSSGYGKFYDKVKMFEPKLNPPGGRKRSSSNSNSRRRNEFPDNHYHNQYHNHVQRLHRQQQPERDITSHKGNESNDGNCLYFSSFLHST